MAVGSSGSEALEGCRRCRQHCSRSRRRQSDPVGNCFHLQRPEEMRLWCQCHCLCRRCLQHCSRFRQPHPVGNWFDLQHHCCPCCCMLRHRECRPPPPDPTSKQRSLVHELRRHRHQAHVSRLYSSGIANRWSCTQFRRTRGRLRARSASTSPAIRFLSLRRRIPRSVDSVGSHLLQHSSRFDSAFTPAYIPLYCADGPFALCVVSHRPTSLKCEAPAIAAGGYIAVEVSTNLQDWTSSGLQLLFVAVTIDSVHPSHASQLGGTEVQNRSNRPNTPAKNSPCPLFHVVLR